MYLLDCTFELHAGVGGKDKGYRQILALAFLFSGTLRLDDVAHAVFGHLQFELPGALCVGHLHQHLSALHGPAVEQVLQVKGEHPAVAGAGYLEILHLFFE